MDELKSPVRSEIKRFIKDKLMVDFYTINDKKLRGQIIWFDKEAFHVLLDNDQSVTLLKRAVVYYNQSSI